MKSAMFLGFLALAACSVPDEGPWMDPGENCMSCHQTTTTRAARGPEWTMAGTVFTDDQGTTGAVGASVLVSDSAGTNLSIITNGAGNFYTAETLTPPLKVAVEFGGKRLVMTDHADSGACNSCHNADGDKPVGWLHVP